MRDPSTKIFWESPDGRFHRMRSCGGFRRMSIMERAVLTQDDYERFRDSDDVCRCASLVTWGVRNPSPRQRAIRILVDNLLEVFDGADWMNLPGVRDDPEVIDAIRRALEETEES